MSSTAQVSSSPAATANAVRPSGRDALEGVGLSAVDPSPSWPSSFSPQQDTEPSSRTAQAWCVPEEMATAVLPLGRSAWTGSQLPTEVPSPSWPWELEPQQATEPLYVMAQVCSPPAETSLAWLSAWLPESVTLSGSCTTTGLGLWVVPLTPPPG